MNKKIITTLSYILLIASAFYIGNYINKAYFNKKAVLEIENNLFDFGSLSSGSDAQHYFKITNTGYDDLLISNIETKCGCTTPEWFERKIPPKHIDSILVKYDTNKLGPFTQSVIIKSNSVLTQNEIFVRGTIIK